MKKLLTWPRKTEKTDFEIVWNILFRRGFDPEWTAPDLNMTVLSCITEELMLWDYNALTKMLNVLESKEVRATKESDLRKYALEHPTPSFDPDESWAGYKEVICLTEELLILKTNKKRTSPWLNILFKR